MSAWPTFYRAERVGTLFYPDLETIAREAAQSGLPAADQDAVRRCLVLIDMQVDFCHEKGALHVPGSEGDVRRIIEFIFRHAAAITQIICSLDSHYPFQIFHAAWWADADGRPPAPFTVISRQEVEQGRWRARLNPEWSRVYVTELERQARKQLMIWPYHVPIGGVGQALDPELWSAIFWHALARHSQPIWWVKGNIPETEHYSLLNPEIAVPGTADQRGSAFTEHLAQYGMMFLAGEAASHCVIETTADLLRQFSQTPEMLSRIFLLRDCMSPVQHPTLDFAAFTETRFQEFAKCGIRFINSTDPLPE